MGGAAEASGSSPRSEKSIAEATQASRGRRMPAPVCGAGSGPRSSAVQWPLEELAGPLPLRPSSRDYTATVPFESPILQPRPLTSPRREGYSAATLEPRCGENTGNGLFPKEIKFSNILKKAQALVVVL